MSTEHRKPPLWLLIAAGFALFSLTACGSSQGAATPTPGLEAISTYAFQTFSAEMARSFALTPPTEIPSPEVSPSPFPTFGAPVPLATISFATSTPPAGGSSDCDDSAWIADITVPDQTHLDPGEKFDKIWLVQNTGTCAWPTSYRVAFVDGLDMGGSTSYVPLAVPVGQQTQLSVSMRAPTSPGQYYGRWKMQNADDQSFGSILSVVIKVDPLAETEED